MTADEMLALAMEMRRAQRAFYASRSSADLAKAKQLEKRFDVAVESMRRGRVASLFDDQETEDDGRW
jgi:hypothetical protein